MTTDTPYITATLGSLGTGVSWITAELNMVASTLAGFLTAIYMGIMIYKALKKK